MVQSINSGVPNQYGSINRIGQTEDGRIVYQISDSKTNQSARVSIAQKDCDMFEKSYKDILESAPKLQKFAEKSPKELERRKTLSKWIMGLSICTGAGIPLIKAKGPTWKQVLLTTGGTILGAVVGTLINAAILTPDGASKFAKATQNLSKLDIKPL